MLIVFADDKLRDLLTVAGNIHRKYDSQTERRTRARLADLAAATCVADLTFKRPPHYCEELVGDRAGQLSVRVAQSNPYRIVFEPAHDPIPRKADGGLDLKSVTAIRILEFVDYH